ncbi:hypothetical protein HK101_004097 [Irineochytrium annulatum]|nr:hypothetical protein HK101_004097 [Irineochytrium annulatum]
MDTSIIANQDWRWRRAEPIFKTEKAYIAVLGEILGKVGWQEKMRDEEIWGRWMKESELAPAAAVHLRKELEHLAANRIVRVDRPAGALISPFSAHGAYLSDTVIDAELARVLRKRLQPAEDLALLEERWHPGSKRQVLDVVHPTPYCLVYGRTLTSGTPTAIVGTNATVPPQAKDNDVSEKFQWLPCEVDVDDDGRVTLRSPIHNLRPTRENAPLYRSIAAALSRMMPMFERSVGSLEMTPANRIPVTDWGLTETSQGEYVNDKLEAFRESEQPGDDFDEDRMREVLEGEWIEMVKVPEVPEEFDPERGLAKEKVVSLRGKRIQVIVKVSSVHLTPEKPSYGGTGWHFEGMKNEAIIATGIYYETVDNITESRLSFREPFIDESFDYEQNEHAHLEKAFDFKNWVSPAVQKVGSLVCLEGRCVTFANQIQHCIEGFSLADPTKPGLRRTLCFFLVSPSARIVSTRDVPGGQRADWAAERVENAFAGKLPTVVVRKVVDEWIKEGCVFSKAESAKLEEELMKERTFKSSRYEDMIRISLCEH